MRVARALALAALVIAAYAASSYVGCLAIQRDATMGITGDRR